MYIIMNPNATNASIHTHRTAVKKKKKGRVDVLFFFLKKNLTDF